MPPRFTRTHGDDYLRGTHNNDVFIGTAGNDTLKGEAGHDKVDYSHVDRGVTVLYGAIQIDNHDLNSSKLFEYV